MTSAQAILQFGPDHAAVPAEHLNHLMFELLLLEDTSDAERIARDDLCARIRRRSSCEAVHVDGDDAALISARFGL